jgi:hypothetical protein
MNKEENYKTHLGCFRISDKEKQNLKEWNTKHLEECHNGKEPYSGAIGGRISYTFTPTSLFTSVSVKCGFCKNSDLNITDMNWVDEDMKALKEMNRDAKDEEKK